MPKSENKNRIALIILSLLGIAIMGYLFSLQFSTGGGSFCNLGEGLSCDIVNKSNYAKLAGIPVSALGLLYFVAVFFVAVWRYNKKSLWAVVFTTIVFLGPSLYLTIIELTVIKSICVFCEASKLIMLAITLLAWSVIKKDFKAKNLWTAIILGIVLALMTYWVHASATPTDEYNEFAQCLDSKGFIMYGSMTCSYCLKQRGLFGDAFQYIKEIECDPRNPNPEVERCVSKNIERTPTWMQEDEQGRELYRFEAGLQPLEKLSEVSGCALPQ